MLKVKIGGYERISKQRARKMYNAGETVYLVPCKVRPDNSWGMLYDANYYNWNKCEPFDTIVAAFEMYNCQYNETGRYTAFYRKEVLNVY